MILRLNRESTERPLPTTRRSKHDVAPCGGGALNRADDAAD